MKPIASWPTLVAITDLSALPARELAHRFALLCAAARPGSVAVLLRDHAASGRTRLELGRSLRDAARRYEQALWLADRLDLALLLGADAVHLGEMSVSARDARMLLPHARISRALHADTEFDSVLGADAYLVSPVFAPRKGRPALGAEGFARLVRRLAPSPVYALGGIDENNAAAVAAGATGVAAIGAVTSPDVRPLLASLRIER